MFDLLIIGGGPASSAGAVYAARKLLKTAVVAGEWGGQSTVSENIKNWIGTNNISGANLGKSFRDHVREYEGDILKVYEGELVTSIEVRGDFDFKVTTNKDTVIEARSILIATGSGRRKLEAKGADIFENKGLTYCASCDGPLFTGMDVVVAGGGNAGFETALQLLAYCKSVTMIHRSSSFKADDITVERTKQNPKFTVLTNTDILSVNGTVFVESLTIKNKDTGEESTIPASGVFVEIGQLPNTDFVANVVTLDENKKVVVDPMTQRASVKGIWAAGDCTNGLYHQNNIAAGDAVKALEDIYIALHREAPSK
jgi:alkyl hydroperoxide reductase subunit F